MKHFAHNVVLKLHVKKSKFDPHRYELHCVDCKCWVKWVDKCSPVPLDKVMTYKKFKEINTN